MTTTIDREVQKRLVDLSVVTLSALILGGSYLLATRVDRERAQRTPPPDTAALVLSDLPGASPAAEPVRTPPPDTAALVLTPPSETVAPPPPIAGLIPAPTPHRRRVVVRRTRAS